ncbi:hypothetical protein A0U87_15190 [Sphingobium sp. MP9-4]|nr:hypothetical protein A0U87_15190 [Sphingobium sp. MP9-4]
MAYGVPKFSSVTEFAHKFLVCFRSCGRVIPNGSIKGCDLRTQGIGDGLFQHARPFFQRSLDFGVVVFSGCGQGEYRPRQCFFQEPESSHYATKLFPKDCVMSMRRKVFWQVVSIDRKSVLWSGRVGLGF